MLEGRKKPSGFVLDFVGIFDKLEQALSFDSGDISGIVKDIEVLKQRFTEMMEKGKKEYLSLIAQKERDKAVEAVLEHFRNEDKRQDFYEFFEELSAIYEILSPDAYLRKYIVDYDTLARMFKIVKEAYDSGITVDREFTRKTAKLVQENTACQQIKSTLDIYEINEDTIKKLEEDKVTDTEKVFNLLRSIGIKVETGIGISPYLHSIGQKAELISLLYKQRQIDTQEALERIKILIDEINKAKQEQAQKNLPTELFTVYWILNDEKIDDAEDKARSLTYAFEAYPYWNSSEEHERKLKQELLKVFTKSKLSVKQSVELANRIIAVLKSA